MNCVNKMIIEARKYFAQTSISQTTDDDGVHIEGVFLFYLFIRSYLSLRLKYLLYMMI